jgi:hypothetical protein
MASVQAVPKQSQGHYIVLSNFNLKSYSGNSGSGANAVAGTFSAGSPVGAFTLLKDLGQTVVSTNRLFRKVAPVGGPNGAVTGTGPFAGDTTVTFGVSTVAGATDYFVGYVELGYEGFGTADPVARFNNL